MNARSLPLALLFLLLASPALAAPPVLTLGQALANAQAHQPQLRQAIAQTAAARARVREVGSSYFPQLSGNGSYLFGPGRSDINQVVAGITSSQTYSLAANLTQLIYDFGQTNDRYGAAKDQAAAQAATQAATALTIALNVRTAFFTARADKELIAVARATLENANRHLDQTRGYVEAGKYPQLNQASALKDVANARVQLIDAQNGYETAKSQLNQAMGIEGGTAYDVTNEAMPTVSGETLALDSLMKEALANRPEFAAFQQQLDAQRRTIAQYKEGWAPSLRGTAGAGTNGAPGSAVFNNWDAGLTLSWPLYLGGMPQAQAQEAEANLTSLQAQVDNLRQQVRLAVDQARLSVAAEKIAIKAAADSTRNAADQLSLAEGRYQAGVGSIVELDDAQLGYTTAAAQQVQAEYKLATARAQLLQALGRM